MLSAAPDLDLILVWYLTPTFDLPSGSEQLVAAMLREFW